MPSWHECHTKTCHVTHDDHRSAFKTLLRNGPQQPMLVVEVVSGSGGQAHLTLMLLTISITGSSGPDLSVYRRLS